VALPAFSGRKRTPIKYHGGGNDDLQKKGESTILAGRKKKRKIIPKGRGRASRSIGVIVRSRIGGEVKRIGRGKSRTRCKERRELCPTWKGKGE